MSLWWFALASFLLVYLLRVAPYYTKFTLFYSLVALIAIFCVPFFAIFDPCHPINCYRSSKLLRLISHLVGIRWEVRGKDILSQKRACVVVANHQSSFDILGMFWIWDWLKMCSAIAKKELFYAWPFGLALWLSGTTFIDRLDSKQAKQQLKNASDKMEREGTKLWLFPEGTRNKKRCIAPFKKGAFHVAITCQAPIMPVVYSPYYFINPHNKYFSSGKVVITALPYIETKGLTLDDIDDLKEKVRTQMEEVYEKVSAELIATLPSDHPGFVGYEK